MKLAVFAALLAGLFGALVVIPAAAEIDIVRRETIHPRLDTV